MQRRKSVLLWVPRRSSNDRILLAPVLDIRPIPGRENSNFPENAEIHKDLRRNCPWVDSKTANPNNSRAWMDSTRHSVYSDLGFTRAIQGSCARSETWHYNSRN